MIVTVTSDPLHHQFHHLLTLHRPQEIRLLFLYPTLTHVIRARLAQGMVS